MKVPGIGRKGAQRIVLELTDRLGAPSNATVEAVASAPTGPGPRDQVVEALVGLGWSAKQAADAVDAVTDGLDGLDGLDGTGHTDMAATLRAALRHLGRSA
jgi:Holliday junction DNA helicase RuvA